MKRFTETAKWDDPWFRSLSGPAKLVFLYIIDRCNNAGFWEMDEESITYHTKLESKHVEGALKALTRGIKAASGWVWVRRFLRHQKNEPLNPANPAHKQIIALISDQLERFSGVPEFEEFLAPLKGLFSPIGKGIGKGKKGSAEGKQLPDMPEKLSGVEGIESAWSEFIQHRKEIKKPLTPLAARNILDSLSERPQDAIAALEMAIRRSWQGFEWSWFDKEKPNGGNGSSPHHSSAPMRSISEQE